ncbi:MAG: flavin reductase family protein [Candidatus Omnitrophica bacterium]|jgi:flavin reductase (DIM6/NTAB) family NADH-FMN oxidoreductase RutF|nr:flavin reductase family protein [Candidatus Omnitrophota bacterium]MDD5078834.1 flavin reductase family protein [Candidatus Omnitrophota bacterium]
MKKSIGAKTIVFPTPVFIIGTYDKSGNPNAMVVAWAGICCSQPPCVSISLREATYTYANILERKAFTVNIPSEKYIKETDYCGIVSGKNENKFKSTGLTAVKSAIVDAPYIEEFPLALECALIQSAKVGLHTIFVGEVKDIKADETALDKDGQPDIEKIKPFIFNPATRTYYGTGKFLAQAFSVGKK